MYEDRLVLSVSGKAEITYIRPAIPTSFNGMVSTFVSGYCETYYMSEGHKKGRININFTADGTVADHITDLGLKIGDTIQISGRLSSRKETRFKDNNGKDIYFSSIRLETVELVSDTTERFSSKPGKAVNKPTPYYDKKTEDQNFDVLLDDLPF
ncbi:MAG: hypothetical protein WC325_12595 [Candidatus Bathyarchaeia archaeon]|jgi:hypothetical protein